MPTEGNTGNTEHTIAAGFAAYLAHVGQRVADGVRSPATLEMHRAHVRFWLRQLGPDLPIGAIDEVLLEGITAQARTFGAETLRKRMSTLRGAVALAHRRRWVPRLPAWPEVIAPWRPRQRRLESYDEAARIAAELPPHRALWFWLALFTGQHASDVERMRWGMEVIGAPDGRGGQAFSTDTVPTLILRNAKSRKVHGLRVPCPLPLARILRAEFERARPKPGDLVVRPWPSRGHTLLRACVRAGLDPICAQDLRRTCASWMVRKLGITPSVCAWFGHSSPQMMARVYARELPPQLGECAAELSSITDGAAAPE